MVFITVHAHTAQQLVVLMETDITIQVKLQWQIFQCFWVQQLVSINLEPLVQISSSHPFCKGRLKFMDTFKVHVVKTRLRHFINVHNSVLLLNFACLGAKTKTVPSLYASLLIAFLVVIVKLQNWKQTHVLILLLFRIYQRKLHVIGNLPDPTDTV